ncbi:MAG: metallophosphoesterase [Bacteroidales bacterium]|nr:metallophosphoesterase [Bacteroidales bacterium]
MFIFFAIVLTIYTLANIYIYIKGLRALDGHLSAPVYTIIFLSLASLFIAGKILERSSNSVMVDILNVAGGFWLAFMLYATLLLLLSDMVILIIKLSGSLPAEKVALIRYRAFIRVTGLAVIIITGGFINSVIPATTRYTVKAGGDNGGEKSYKIVAVSDIHMGTVVRRRSLRKLSSMIKKENPDIIFFLGDIVDGEINPVLRDDLLTSLSLPEGAHTLMITGNHEYIGGISRTTSYIEDKGYRILNDEVMVLENGIQVVGRRDRDSFRFSGEERKSLDELLAETDPSRTVIVLDHQPPLKGSRPGGDFDLMLSGHTHRGQMWPLEHIVKRIYDSSDLLISSFASSAP